MKRIKMLLYGEPGVGKSVFALKAPKPFFVCTDGNYEWLDEFGADPNAHKNVSSWADMKDVLESDFDGYETVVVDLLEDGFKWCEQEYCVRNKIEHVSDVGYGKAYDATRNEFFITISKRFRWTSTSFSSATALRSQRKTAAVLSILVMRPVRVFRTKCST